MMVTFDAQGLNDGLDLNLCECIASEDPSQVKHLVIHYSTWIMHILGLMIEWYAVEEDIQRERRKCFRQ